MYFGADGKQMGGGTYCVDRVDALPARVPFAVHPLPIKIGKQSVDIIGCLSVPIPLRGIIL